jgi:lysophospholipase L1-like esterase
VLLGARTTLRRYLPKVGVDAAVGRQAGAIVGRIEGYQAKGKLAPVVIIHTGTNGVVTTEQLTSMLTTLKDRRLVVVVNTDVPRRWEKGNNERIAAIVPKFPNAVLADWKSISEGRREYFVTDGVHLTGSGMKAYAALIQATIYAKLYPGKRPPAPAPA